MASFVEPLVLGRVIGDVVDIFVPTMTMVVNYGLKHVSNGCTIKPSMTIDRPTIQISGCSAELYTLVLTDPDAPSPSEPNMRELVHWMVVDIPGGTDPTKGQEILPYMAPRPHLGIHRLVFILFEQKDSFHQVVLPPAHRAHFNTREFATKYGLGMPVAGVFFNCQKEPVGSRKHLNLNKKIST